VAEDGTPGAGWGGTVAHALHTRLWHTLRGPVELLGAADRVLPAAAHLEEGVFLGAADLRRAIARRVAGRTADTVARRGQEAHA
jgi:pyruvate dehydrogenase E1 component beta subunit